jgi:hypothetical protein
LSALRLGVLALATLAGGCSQPCGFDVNEGGLSVIIKDAATKEGRLGPGAYVFTVTTELGALTWSCTVDEAHPDGVACDTSQTLASDEDVDAEGRQTLLLAARVIEGEYRLELSLLASGLTTGPEELAVSALRDGEIVADEEYTPMYVLSRAGGDGCGQTYVVDEAPTVLLVAP